MNKSTSDIRQAFLDFFHSKGHQIITSSSLVPENDSTLLFTNAGMNQFKNVFLGLNESKYSRVATSQRCMRAGGKHNDLENVGYTSRHHTFFEMLGNFSFGDYFKHEAIQYAWELLTSKNFFNLSQERLWITVHRTDKQSYEIWEKEIGIPRERIIQIGEENHRAYFSKNFWQMGDIGPCGPCTEIFYDQGNHIYGGPPGTSEEDGDRYIEIWNIVFIQFNRHFNGNVEILSKPSVDTGMGLERIAAVLQCVNSNYEIDLFRDLIEAIMQITCTNNPKDKSLRVIADHIRSCVFLIADGIIPSNENRGYVLRRIIRRAIRHGNMLGVKDIFFYKLVNPLIEIMGETSAYMKDKRIQVEKILRTEEEKFSHTLERGLALLNEELIKITGNTLNGEVAFRLYDTYGFPLDLTADVCRERNVKIDEAGFKAKMIEQKKKTRESRGFFVSNYNPMMIFTDNISEFQGYEHLEIGGTVTELFVNGKSVNNINLKQEAVVILDKTPFYAESGGQVGDKGELKGHNFNFVVDDTQKYDRAIGHIGKLISGSLKVGDNVLSLVDKEKRKCICLNHSATHLMYSALRKILGNHVTQKGSLINEKMLRFDFSHFVAMTLIEIREVENLLNKQIRRNIPIEVNISDTESVKEEGIKILLNNKRHYNEHVRILRIGDFSSELCGGTHASRTGDIGLFRITSEFSKAAGIRRIEAVTGENAIININAQSDQLYNISQLLKVDSLSLSNTINSILKRTYQLEKKLKKLQEKVIEKDIEYLYGKVVEIKGVKLLISKVKDVEPKVLHTMVNLLKRRLGTTVTVLATVMENKIFVVSGVSKDITSRLKAEELVNMLTKKIGGKGGGCPEIAQASAIDSSNLSTVLNSVKNWIIEKI